MTENTFAFRLKELLEVRQLTLQAVGTALGISRTAVHKWTRGGEIDYANLRKLADLLAVNWVWLRYGEEALRDLQDATPVELPMTDVRRRYTTEIMESEARMTLAQEGAGIVTWEWNLVSDEVKYSANVEAVYGWSVTSNDEFWARLDAADVSAMQAMYQTVIDSGQACEYHFRIRHPDGGLRWISSRARVVKDSAGRPVKMVGISMDSTARIEAEEALRESEARFRTIFELTRGALAYSALDGRMLRVNDSLCALLGYSQAELCQMSFQQLTHAEDLAHNLQLLDSLLAARIERYSVEKRCRHRSGDYIWVRVHTVLQRCPRTAEPQQLVSLYEDLEPQLAERRGYQARIDALEQRLRELGAGVA